MLRKIMLPLLCFICLVSCSSDSDSNPADKITSVTMKINGIPYTFEALGRGIDLIQDGYKLSLNFGKYDQSPYQERAIYLETKYRKKGDNIIQMFHYHQYVDGVGFDGDFTDGTFQNNISVNTNSRFKATFSGTLTIEGQTVTITDGNVNYVYDEPFD